MNDRRVAVIGGGPAGMMAAIAAAREGANVFLLEGNEKLGKKLYITGKGRCNLTNACETEEFFGNIPRNPRFLRSCIGRFDSRALMAFVEGLGVPLAVERGDRVFPASGKASDVTRALQKELAVRGVTTRTGDKCVGLVVKDGAIAGIKTASGPITCDAAIVATGGASYPVTGSTGDGYRFAKEAGHRVLEPRGSLVPLETAQDWPKGLTGLSLKNVELCAANGGKALFQERGEMLFTHFGVSGPLVLSLSAHLPEDLSGVEVWLDLKPALDRAQLDARLLREIEAAQRKRAIAVIDSLMPHSLALAFMQLAGMDASLAAHQITRQQRIQIAGLLKRVPMAIRGPRPLAEAVVTRGGVDVKEVDPKTMQSKFVAGLYFAGEVLDVDGYTGGFNLQIAFSTGYAAGLAAGGAMGGSGGK